MKSAANMGIFSGILFCGLALGLVFTTGEREARAAEAPASPLVCDADYPSAELAAKA
jgi:hypothetical protein